MNLTKILKAIYTKMNKKKIVLIIIVTLLLILIPWSDLNNPEELPLIAEVPAFTLYDQWGNEFNREMLNGKISIIDFIFTNCPGPCPVMSGNMKILYSTFSESQDVQFISISVDPDRDTFEILQEYAQLHGVTDDRWIFLRGDINKVVDLSENGFLLAAENLPMGHSVKFALVDETASIRGYYSGTDEQEMNKLKIAIKRIIN